MEKQYTTSVNQSEEYQILYDTNLKLGDLLDLIDILLCCMYEDEYVGMLGAIRLNLSAILDPIQKHIYK